ncbi:MAG TPA: dTMP kinase [Quisquiliibacterium sp.]|nr:dTMP kinase [Quisquiliibacterium sp.]HQN11578.1 dTMP kinase [Quisquiliibacterium sp.]HQP65797.1 dTMP kinase [Quisquiliibacterium sp.]
MRGRFITFEGIDGAGKSTHLDWFADALRARGATVLRTREPGGSPLAERLRALLLSEAMSITTEILLMFAARQDHLDTVVGPALARGDWVLCDRFTDSTFAYQGAGRGAGSEHIAMLERWVQAGLQPDRTYLFDLPPEEAARRRAGARAPDRFEQEDLDFFGRVRAGYALRVQQDPARFVTIDARQDIAAIRAVLLGSIDTLWA